jgi:O-antigen chain-terminating methyltransferase
LEDEIEARQEVRSEVLLQGLRLERTFQHSTGARREDLSESLSETSRQPEDAHALDAFYVALEKRFRGSRDEIKERLKVYVPILTEARVGSNDQGVLDVGCGRGEWLEVLKEASIAAKGIDRNLLLVAECRKRGLDVTEGDALAELRAAEDASLGAVTGFHIVEHLPLEEAISLIDESLRVLRPGGLLVFETPNPQNVLVGSCNFYFDPTHRNPIPPPVLRFFLESRGFTRVDIMELNPSDAPNVEGDSELVQRFNRLFYGPMDYAVIGRKAGV